MRAKPCIEANRPPALFPPGRLIDARPPSVRPSPASPAPNRGPPDARRRPPPAPCPACASRASSHFAQLALRRTSKRLRAAPGSPSVPRRRWRRSPSYRPALHAASICIIIVARIVVPDRRPPSRGNRAAPPRAAYRRSRAARLGRLQPLDRSARGGAERAPRPAAPRPSPASSFMSVRLVVPTSSIAAVHVFMPSSADGGRPLRAIDRGEAGALVRRDPVEQARQGRRRVPMRSIRAESAAGSGPISGFQHQLLRARDGLAHRAGSATHSRPAAHGWCRTGRSSCQHRRASTPPAAPGPAAGARINGGGARRAGGEEQGEQGETVCASPAASRSRARAKGRPPGRPLRLDPARGACAKRRRRVRCICRKGREDWALMRKNRGRSASRS